MAEANHDNRHKDTRERLLDAAEQLFMQHGYEGTSMRQVTSEAEVNLAAANYHFGSKEALMQAVLHRRLGVINRERLRLLDEAEAKAGGGPLKPSVIVECYFGTLFRVAAEQKAGGETFLRLLGRTFTEPSNFIRAFMSTEYADVLERYKQAMFHSLPDVPKAEIVWRFHFMLGATSYAIAGTDSLRLITDWQVDEGSQAQDEHLLPRLMSFMLGGLRAPLPQFEKVVEATTGSSEKISIHNKHK